MALIKSPERIQAGRESGAILARALDVLIAATRPGVTTDELDALFVKTIEACGAQPAFLGYKGYPKSICTSINDQVVHAIPGSTVLKEGDIIGLDCGVIYKGFYTDMARTVGVGHIMPEAQQLIDVTARALDRGIEQMIPGKHIGDISHAVQQTVTPYGYGIVRVLVGHGVGDAVHEEPNVPNYGQPGRGMELKVGMVLAVEPMINIGKDAVVFGDDGWTVSTADGTLSAHFEDTIAIGVDGPEILTRPQ